MQKCSSSSVVLCAIFLLCGPGMDGVWVTFGVVYGIKAQELHIRKKNPRGKLHNRWALLFGLPVD